MGVVAVQLGVFLYAILATFVSSAMSVNRRESRRDSGMMVATGWGLLSFSVATTVFLLATAAAMALGYVSEDAIHLPL